MFSKILAGLPLSKKRDAVQRWAKRHAATASGKYAALRKLQALHNMPMLLAIATDLHRQAEMIGLDRLLFMARDTCLLYRLYAALYPNADIEYVYANRMLLRHGDDAYFQYLNARLTNGAALVDLCGTGESLDIASHRLKVKRPKLYSAFWVDHKKRPLRNVDISGLAMCSEVGIDNTWLELANYDTIAHPCAVDSRGIPTFDDMGTIDQYAVGAMHETAIGMIDSAPTLNAMDADAVRTLAIENALALQHNRPTLERFFPNHMYDEFDKYNEIRKTNDQVHVITSIVNRGWSDVKHWLQSLLATGFDGHIHLILYNDDPILEAMLHHYDVTVHKCTPLENWQIVVYRFRDLARIAASLPANDWIVATDGDDVVFQRDPAEYLATLPPDTRLIAPSECIRFADQWWAGPNMVNSFPEYCPSMLSETLHNAGSIAGRASDIAELSADIFKMCLPKPEARNHDQAAMNILLRQAKYRDKTLLAKASDGWCWCMASTHFAKEEELPKLQEPLATIRDGVAYHNDVAEAFFLLHHYNRDENLKRQVHETVKRRWDAWRMRRKAEQCK